MQARVVHRIHHVGLPGLQRRHLWPRGVACFRRIARGSVHAVHAAKAATAAPVYDGPFECSPEVCVNTIMAPVSIGELADKITILEIKSDRITDPHKRDNVRVELDGLTPLWERLVASHPDIAALKVQLRAVNERMWDVQDSLRDKEARQQFDAAFVQLARAVGSHNGERVGLKNDINRLAGSQFVEEKQYK